MSVRLYKILLLNFFILILNNVQAAQLIDSIPSKLQTNWSVCLHFKVKDPACEINRTANVSYEFSDAVNLFVYSKEFIISSELQQSVLGLWLNTIDDVDEVRVNGRLIGKTGNFPPLFEGGFRYKRLYLIPSIILNYNQFNYLEIKTFSSTNQQGMGQQPVVIGDYLSIAQSQQQDNYIYIVCISLLLLLTTFQIFYYFMVKGSIETIYLSIFLVSFSVVAFIRSQMPLHIGLDLTSTFKIEMFMISTGLVGFTFFIFRFFDLEIRKYYTLGAFVLALPGVVSIIYPNPLYARHIAEVGYWIICISSFLTIGSAVVISVAKRRSSSLIIGILCFFCWVAFCFDAATQSNAIFKLRFELNSYLMPMTITIMGSCMVLAVTYKYWQIFKGATYDHVTGTLLRPAFFQRLSEEIQRSQKDTTLLLVAVISIQEIKNINAGYGYNAGNNILLVVSDVITSLLKPFDLVCHFSDDEFCIAATVASSEDAENTLRNIHRELISTQQIVGIETELFIHAKIGGVIYNSEQHLSVSQLLQDANYGLAKTRFKGSKDYLLLNQPSAIL